MLIDLIGTSFCEVAIDEERSYVSIVFFDHKILGCGIGEHYHLKRGIFLRHLICFFQEGVLAENTYYSSIYVMGLY
jgi:hypothetical protein